LANESVSGIKERIQGFFGASYSEGSC
jgi:hypothetical protein